MPDSDKRVMLYMDRHEEDERRHLELLAATFDGETVHNYRRQEEGVAEARVRMARAIQAEVRRTSDMEASDE